MLSTRFPIRYKNPAQTPIQLFLAGDQLLISCHLCFSSRALTRCPSGSDRTYAELVCEGIRTYWEGFYLMPLPDGPQPLSVRVQITTGKGRRAALVQVKRMFIMPAHVRSPIHRLYWGVFKTGQLESIGTNWSLEQPGRMILPYMDDPEQIKRIAAHEAGHLFGIGDAYAAIYRFYDAVPGTGHYMMHSNWAVQPEEVLMMLRAHVTGRMQFFPRSFQWRRFRKGFADEIDQRIKMAESRVAHWSEMRARVKAHRQKNAGAAGAEDVSKENMQSEYNATVTGSSVVSGESSVDNEDGTLR